MHAEIILRPAATPQPPAGERFYSNLHFSKGFSLTCSQLVIQLVHNPSTPPQPLVLLPRDFFNNPPPFVCYMFGGCFQPVWARGFFAWFVFGSIFCFGSVFICFLFAVSCLWFYVLLYYPPLRSPNEHVAYAFVLLIIYCCWCFFFYGEF